MPPDGFDEWEQKFGAKPKAPADGFDEWEQKFGGQPAAPGTSIGAEAETSLPRDNVAGIGFESEVGVNNKRLAPPPDPREMLSRKAQDLAWRIEGWGPREIRQAFWDEHGRPRADRAAYYVKNMEQQIKAASDRDDLLAASGGTGASDLRRTIGSAIGPFKRVGEMISGGLGLTDERAVEFSREVDDYRRDKAARSGFWGQVENIMLDVAPSLPVQALQVMAGGAVAGAPGVVGAAAVTGAANDPENPERGALIGGGSALVGGLAGRFLAPAGSTAARVVGTEVAGNVIPGMVGRAAMGGEALDPAAMLFDAATGAGGGVSRYRGQQAKIRGEAARLESTYAKEPFGPEPLSSDPAERIMQRAQSLRRQMPRLTEAEAVEMSREVEAQKASLDNASQPGIEAPMRRLDPEIAAEEAAAERMRSGRMVDLPPGEAREAEAALQNTRAEIDAADDIGRRIDKLAATPKDQLVGMGGGRAERIRQRGAAGQVPIDSMAQFFARWHKETGDGLGGGRRVLMERFGLDGAQAERVIQHAVSTGLVGSDAAQFSRDSSRLGYGRDPMPRVPGKGFPEPEGPEPIGSAAKTPTGPQEPTGRSEPPSEPPVAPGVIRGSEPVMGDPVKPGEVSPAKPARGMANPERGTLGLPSSEALANSAVGQGVRGSTSIVSRLLKHFFQPLKEGLADLPGGAALKQLSERALDESTRFTRVMNLPAEEAMRLSNNTPEAQTYINAKGAPGAPSPLLEALEGRAEGGPMIRALRSYLDRAAEMFFGAGFLRDDGSPVNAKSTAAPRLNHADGLDLLRSGRWVDSTLVDDTAAMPANIKAGWTKERLTAHFKEVEARLNSDGPEAADVAVALESKREIPSIPGWVGLNGETIQFLENNPRRYIERLYNGQTARYGFGSAWGQGSESPTDAILKNMGQADRAKVRDYFRAVHGAPLEDPVFRVGDPSYPLVRSLSAVKNTASALALSTNALKNTVPEMLGGLTAMTGRYADTLRAIWNMLVDYKGTVKNLEALGLKTRVPWDKTIDPLRAKTEKVERAARAIRTLGTTWGEEIQETFAGEKGRLITQRAQRGLANGGVEAPELRAFTELTDASPAEIAQMRDGTMSSARFQEIGLQFARRLVQETQGSNVSGAQLSRAQHSRWARALTAFTKFSTMYQYRAIKRITSGGVDIVKGVASGDFGQVYGGTTQILKTLGGAALMNGSAQIIGSFLMGGKQKGMATLNELYEDPLGFTFGAAGQAFVSGYAGSFLQATGQGGDAVSAFFPVHVTNQLLHLVGALNNEKEYAGRGFFGRLRVFLNRTTPIAAAVDRGILGAMFGGAEGRQLRSAKSAFYKFKRDNGLMKDFDRGAYSEWDGAMENLARLIEDGADPDVVEEAIAEAAVIGTDGKDSVRKSLLGKKMLTKQNIDPADLARFFEHAMPADVDALIAHDAMLERVAESIGTASERRGMGRGRKRR